MAQLQGWLIALTIASVLTVYAFYGDEFWGGEIPEFEWGFSLFTEFAPGALNLITVGVFDPDIELSGITRLIIFLAIHAPWFAAVFL